MTNFHRMTIRRQGESCQVFKLKRQRSGGWVTDGAGSKFVWFVGSAAKAQASGTYEECQKFIAAQGAEFMTEHGVPC